MGYNKIINKLKGDAALRERVAEWLKNSDPTPIITEWFSTYWDDDVMDYLGELPEGYCWEERESMSSRYMLVLDYVDENDNNRVLELSVNTQGTPGCCQSIVSIEMM